MKQKKEKKKWTDEEKIEFLEKTIKETKEWKAKFSAMKNKTTRPETIGILNETIKDLNTTIKIFEAKLKEIRTKKPS